MNKRLANNMAFLLGLAALALRRMLYMTAVDEKGLLRRMHPLSLSLLGLTAATLLLIYFAVRKQEESVSCGECNARNLGSALGHGVMALGILVTVLPGGPRALGYLSIAWRWLGLLSPLCLLVAGAVRLAGKKPFFLLHVIPCLFFAVHIVCNYQVWSGNSQMQDYFFALLGVMALMFFSFYMAALEVGCGSRRMALGMGMAASFLCLAELANSVYPVLYFAGAIWTRAELSGLSAED